MRLLSPIAPIILFVGACVWGGHQEQRTEDSLDEKVDAFQLQDDTILDALGKFNSKTHYSVSVELILKNKLSDQNIENPRSNSLIETGTAKHVLDEICALDDRYTWAHYRNTINVYPRASLAAGDAYLMNRHLSDVSLKDIPSPDEAIFQTVARLSGPLEQIGFMQTGGPPGFPKPETFVWTGVTVRQAFDEVADRMGKGYGWTLGGAQEFRVLRFHAKLLPEERHPRSTH